MGMVLPEGATVGSYRIVGRLGEGSLATAYKAYHPALDRHVILKVLKAGPNDDPSLRVRFQHEARHVARLDHPNIVPVLDFLELDGLLCLITKFVDGETLKDRLVRGPLALDECGRMLGGVGAALQHAHDLGVVHCDLKPSNIIIGLDGNVYLTDFGVARLATADLSHASPDYVSPEQARNAPQLDGRADQYALGVVMFEALTGVLPFRADDARGVIHQHLLSLPPQPSAINPKLSQSVEDVILRALAKHTHQRFADVAALVAAFLKAAAPPRPPTAPLRPRESTQVLPNTIEFEPERVEHGADVTVMLMMPGGQMFKLSGKNEYQMGRSEPTRPFKPDVDLADWQGMELGVSRRHGQLHFDNGRLYYTDLKSSNGSRVNGAGLYAEIPVALNDGDEICLGKIAFRVYFGP
jgi:serine/threonine protein kinase